MRTVRSVLVGVVVGMALTGCGLIPPMACPAALLSGQLAVDEAGDEPALVVATDHGTQAVVWPDGYSADFAGEVAQLRGPFGQTIAAEGEPIYIGGGMNADDTAFVACGHVSREPPGG
jgi:hypothetical protein